MRANLIEEFKRITGKDGSMPCIDCGLARWQEGPSGGMSTSYQCAECGSRFNVGPGTIDRIGFNDKLRIEWLDKRLSGEEQDRSSINRHAAIRHTKRKRLMSTEVPDA